MKFKPNDNAKGKLLNETQISANIQNALESLDGEQIAKLHNEACSEKIQYVEDSLWEVIGHD